MKRIIVVMFCIVIACVGCSKPQISELASQEMVSDNFGGILMHEGDGSQTISLTKIPYPNIKYNNSTFTLSDIQIRSVRSETEHGYFPYITVEFDISSLTEDEIYWLFDKGEFSRDFSETMYFSSEKNHVDFEEMEQTQLVHDDSKAIACFAYAKAYKYELSDIALTSTIQIAQDETYEYTGKDGKKTELNKRMEYYLRINSPNSEIQIKVND